MDLTILYAAPVLPDVLSANAAVTADPISADRISILTIAAFPYEWWLQLTWRTSQGDSGYLDYILRMMLSGDRDNGSERTVWKTLAPVNAEASTTLRKALSFPAEVGNRAFTSWIGTPQAGQRR
jgi:hypothetical protein